MNKKRRKRRIRPERILILLLILVAVLLLLVFALQFLYQSSHSKEQSTDPAVTHIIEKLEETPVISVDPTLMTSLYSEYAVVMDANTGRIIAEKNGTERMYPASLTKMMTAIVTIENEPDLSKTVEITDEMLTGLVEENASVAGFSIGDTPTIRDVLYGMALPSGADACRIASYDVAGNEEAFIGLMNEKAEELGMTHTHFSNTTGLHEDSHYTSGEDLAILLHYCIQNETFRTVFSTSHYTTSPLASAPYGLSMQSTVSKAESHYGIELPGLIGGKTGFTYEAGKCLATWSKAGSHTIIIITGNASDDMYGTEHYMDHGFLLSQIDLELKNSLE